MYNPLQKAKELIAGRVDYADLCRYATHNLAERKAVVKALSARRLSKPRIAYLKQRQKSLAIEKSLLETKERRIRPHAVSEHEFII